MAPFIVLGAKGVDLSAFVIENTTATVLFVSEGLVIGFAVAVYAKFLGLKYKGFKEKKKMQDDLKRQDDEIVGLRAEIARLEVERNLAVKGYKIDGQIAAIIKRENSWKKSCK